MVREAAADADVEEAEASEETVTEDVMVETAEDAETAKTAPDAEEVAMPQLSERDLNNCCIPDSFDRAYFPWA